MQQKSVFSFWVCSDHHCLPPMLPALDEGWGRPTRSAHPSNEVHKPDKLWFRMKSLGEKLKEANEHEKSLQPRHRWAALPTSAAANLLATACFPSNPPPTNNQQLPVAKKPGFLLRNGNIHSQLPIRAHFCHQPCPRVPLGWRVSLLTGFLRNTVEHI